MTATTGPIKTNSNNVNRTEVCGSWGGGEKEQITINRSMWWSMMGTEEKRRFLWFVSQLVSSLGDNRRCEGWWPFGSRSHGIFYRCFLPNLLLSTTPSPRCGADESILLIRSDPVSPCRTLFYLPARFNYYSLAALVCTSINHIGKLVFPASWVTLLDALQPIIFGELDLSLFWVSSVFNTRGAVLTLYYNNL